MADNDSNAYSARREDVPDHAIWLITTNPDHTAPTVDWHNSPESLEPSSSPPPPPQHQSYDRRIEKRSRQRFWIVFGALLILGPFIGFLLLGSALLVAHNVGASLLIAHKFGADAVPRALLNVGQAWILVSIFVLEIYALTLATLSARGHRWRRREHQRTLGKLTPIEFETINQPALQAA